MHGNPIPQIALPGLEIQRELGDGTWSRVYEARHDGITYALKVPKSDEVERWWKETVREAALLATLRHPSLPVVIDVCRPDSGQPYLLMEYLDGTTLHERLREGPLDVIEAVGIGIQLAEALSVVHAHGLVHRDIKPLNVVLTSKGVAKLIDFGLAATSEAAASSSEVIGSLGYTAPEQTGMLRRPVDGRADLYSLGVVLFECLTGEPPLEGTDAAQLLRAHAKLELPSVGERDANLPARLVEIVDRLLRKDPDDRYQSAERLRLDLEGSLATSSSDTSNRVSPTPASEQLIGRAEERKRLEDCWHQAREGRLAALTLEGEGGSGKTRLASELVRRVLDDGGYVLSGRCRPDELEPLGGIRRALESIVERAGSLPSPERERLCRDFREAMAGASRFLATLSPVLAQALDIPPDTRAVGDQEQMVSSLFDSLRTLAREHGAVLILDDVQWIDETSNRILRYLLRERDARIMVLLCTRPTESECDHIERYGDSVALRALTREETGLLLQQQLGGLELDDGLLDVVFERSRGNAFAALTLLRGMLTEGHLQPRWGVWVLNRSNLERVPLPVDVVESVLRRARAVDTDTQQALRAAALLDSELDLDLLGRVSALDEQRLAAAIAQATDARLLIRSGASRYEFFHERVREGVLQTMSEAARARAHARAAAALRERFGLRSRAVYAIAKHHFEANGDSLDETGLAAHISAARRAMLNNASIEAYQFLQQSEEASRRLNARSLSYLELYATVAFRIGRIERAIELYRECHAVSQPGLERARVCSELARVYLGEFDTDLAWEFVLEGLRELDAPMPSTTLGLVMQLLRDWTVASVAGFFGAGFGTARDESRARKQIISELYVVAGHISYFHNRPLLLIQSAVRLLRVARNLGRSPELVRSYANIAVVYAVLGRVRTSDRYIDEALEHARALGNRALRAYVELYRAIACHISGRASRAETLMAQVLLNDGAWLSVSDCLNGYVDIVMNLYLRGFSKSAWAWHERALSRARASETLGRGVTGHPYTCFGAALLAGRGRASTGHQELARYRGSTAIGATEVWRPMMVFLNEAFFYWEQGETGEPVEDLFRAFDAFGLNPRFTPFHITFFWVAKAHIRLAQLREEPGSPARATALQHALRELKQAATTPLHRLHHDAVRTLADASRGERVERRLDALERRARALECPAIQVELDRCRAALHYAAGQRRAAATEASRATTLAAELGLGARERRIRREFRLGETEERAPGRKDLVALRSQAHFDALLEISEEMAKHRQPHEQIQSVLDRVVALSGADRAFLFLLRGSHELELVGGRGRDGVAVEDIDAYSHTVVSRAVEQGEPILLSSTEEGEEIGAQSVVAHQLRSVAAAPMRLRDGVVGAIYLDSRVIRGVFTDDDLELLTILANQIAIMLEVARLLEVELEVARERDQRHTAEALAAAFAEFNAINVAERLYERLVDHVCLLLDAPHARVETGRANVVVTRGASNRTKEPATVRLPLGRRHEDPELVVEGREPVWAAKDHALLRALVSCATVAVDRVRLLNRTQTLAAYDELTGVLNRRRFIEVASEAIRKHRCAILILDIDHFKAINDEHGHLVGDEVLRAAAERCNSVLRDVDAFGRYGGEEFTAVIPGVDLDTARRVAERMRLALSETPIRTRAGEISASLSAGLALSTGDEALETLLSRADAALYAAKAEGRDRVNLAPSPDAQAASPA